MKKILVLCLAALLIAAFAACNNEVSISSGSNSGAEQSVSQQLPNFSGAYSSQNDTSSSYGAGQGSSQGASQAASQSASQAASQSSSQAASQSASQAASQSSSQAASQSSGGGAVEPLTPGEYTLKNADFTGTSYNAGAAAFNAEGYGKNVTGGGNLRLGDDGYVQVSTAQEFIKAIGRKNYDDKTDTLFATRPMVVEVMNDIDLGYNVIGSTAQGYSDVIKANDASTSPIIKQTGVSVIYISGRENLTIFSKNGAKLKHCCLQMRGTDGSNGQNQNCKNIIIRNVTFYGAWEWDDSGKYDNNDWDSLTIRADKGPVSDIWIDHCTFYKPYDGTIDIKYGATDITVSWCAFIPFEDDDAEFLAMMEHLEANRSSFPNYNTARNAGATVADMINYANINKKVQLIGHSDNVAGDENIRITYCNNYYENCTERLPRLRMGKAHVYNCIFNARAANALKNSISSRITGWPSDLSFASNGSLGTNYGKLLLENCYIDGINTPLRNNNEKAEAQFTGSVEALYTYYTVENIDRSWKYDKTTNTQVKYSGRYTFLGHSTVNDGNLLSAFPMPPLAFDTDAFKSELGYEYLLYDSLKLNEVLEGRVGAGAINLDTENWEKSSYTSLPSYLSVPSGAVKGSTANLGASRK